MILRKITETTTTITLGWDPVPGAVGYRLTREKAAGKFSHSWNGAMSQARFSKDSAWYSVEALGSAATGRYPAAPSPVPSRSLLGVSAHVPGDDAAAEAHVKRLAEMGVKILRDDFAWSGVEQTRGRYDWSHVDRICALAVKYGMKLLPQIGYAPPWANGDRGDKWGPLATIDFGHWASTIAARLHSRYPGLVVGIEPWNEPNLPGPGATSGGPFLNNPATGKGATPAYYVKLANAAYYRIKEVCPIPVVAGSTAGVGNYQWDEHGIPWMEECLRLDIKFDEWSVHPYYFDTDMTAETMLTTAYPTGWNRCFWITDYQRVDNLLASYGYHGPIHATEVGPPTHGPNGKTDTCVTEAAQAEWLRRAWPLWKAQPRAGHFLFYTGKDADTFSTNDRETHFGLLRSDGTEKPAVAVFRALAGL